jgi:protein-tyrosine phosphatase
MRVLFVCLGNICRSPTARYALEELLRAAPEGLDLQVDSCGTSHWHEGEGAYPETAAAARRAGLDLSSHRARGLRKDDFLRFDLLVAMDRSNLRELEAQRPAESRAELLRFMALLPDDPRWDVPDPWGGGSDGHDEIVRLARAGAKELLRRIEAGTVRGG